MSLSGGGFMNSVHDNHGNQVFVVDRLIQCNIIQAGHILGHKVDSVSCIGNYGTSWNPCNYTFQSQSCKCSALEGTKFRKDSLIHDRRQILYHVTRYASRYLEELLHVDDQEGSRLHRSHNPHTVICCQHHQL